MKSDVYVAVGCNCDVALILRRRRLRREAFPFDWLVSSLPCVTEAIVNDFEGFLDNGVFVQTKMQTEFDAARKSKRAMKHMYLPTYGLVSLHDYYGDVDNASEVEEKYMRRILRFRDLMDTAPKTGKRVVFCVDRSTTKNVRHAALLTSCGARHINPTPKGKEYDDQIDAFRAAISAKYPELDFVIERVAY